MICYAYSHNSLKSLTLTHLLSYHYSEAGSPGDLDLSFDGVLQHIGYGRFSDGSAPNARPRKASDKMQDLQQTVADRTARLEEERRDRAQRGAHALARKDIDMGTVGKGSNYDKLCSEQLALKAAGQIPVPHQYVELEQRRNRCSTCNQPGHNTACCTTMTVFSVVQQYIRKRGPKMFQDAIVLTKEIQAELSHAIFNDAPQEVADVDTDRDSPIYPEGYEAGTFNGPVDADIDLTRSDDPEPVLPPAKKPKPCKSSKPKYSNSIGTSSHSQQMDDDGDSSSDPLDWTKSKGKSKGKAKGKAKGNAKGKAKSKGPYSRSAAVNAGESSGDDDDNESSEDSEDEAARHARIIRARTAWANAQNAQSSTVVMDLCSNSAGTSADVVDLCGSESCSDSSSKK